MSVLDLALAFPTEHVVGSGAQEQELVLGEVGEPSEPGSHADATEDHGLVGQLPKLRVLSEESVLEGLGEVHPGDDEAGGCLVEVRGGGVAHSGISLGPVLTRMAMR
jgi:hypothetical protein